MVTINNFVDFWGQVDFQFVLEESLLTDALPETSNLFRRHLLVRLRWLVQLCKLHQESIIKYLLGRGTHWMLCHDFDGNRMLTWDDLSIWTDHIVLDIGGFNLEKNGTL